MFVWAVWGTACAALWRFGLPRFVFRFSNRLAAVGLSYVAMVALFFAAFALLDNSGWNILGANNEPHQRVAEFIAIFSPFGLPLLVGVPIMLGIDILMSIKRLIAHRSL